MGVGASPPHQPAPGSAAAASSGYDRDHLSILAGTSQNLLGVMIALIATAIVNLLLSNTLGPEGFGVVTIVTQAAFVVSFATRAGMDMAVLREVAIDVGAGKTSRVSAKVARAVLIAGLVSSLAAVLAVLAAGAIRQAFSLDDVVGRRVVEAAAVGLPFLAVTNVWLAATRGLKIMRYTLYVFWAGQPILWIVLLLAGWAVSGVTAWVGVFAYSLSWLLATGAAWHLWRRTSAGWEHDPLEAGALSRLTRYAGPRAPAALFSQLLFWTDLFVLTHYVSRAEVGVYAGVLRVGQVVVLFLTSVNLMFSPYVADLHARGATDRLDRLFKNLTRWTLAATLPAFLLLVVAPAAVLRVLGPEFDAGRTALLIVLGGQLVNIATGSVGFVLIMVGRTGWDLAVYSGALFLSIGSTIVLAPRYGMEGAAIANAVTFAVSNLVRLLLVKRFVGIQPYDRRHLRLIAPTVIGLLAMWGAHNLSEWSFLEDLAITGTAGGLAYLAAYAAMGLTTEEREGAKKLLSSRLGRKV